MEEEKIEIVDESNDRKYFSLLPHYILNHSTAVDQALYMQMKRYAGESQTGECWASKNTLLKKLGIGHKALNKSIKYLLERNWIFEKGFRFIITKGGQQKVTVFGVKDIWKMNVDFYETKGGAESTYPEQGGAESNTKVVSKVTKGGAESTSNKNHIKEEPYKNTLALKSTHSEFNNVKLTEDEHQKLVERIGSKETSILVEELGSYIASTGKRYSSHYATLLNWARRKDTKNYKQKTITTI